MEKVSKKGRTYIKGRALQPDLRNLIIDDLLKGGGDSETSYFPGEFKRVADKFKVSDSTIKTFGFHSVLTNDKQTPSRRRKSK